MSAAPAEHPYSEPEAEPSLLDEANALMERLPGYRVEIIGGQILVSPPADGAHGRGLTKLMRPFITAGLDGEATEVIQAIGIWLPDGREDYAIPDLAVVDADFEDHLVENNCYDPLAFRLVLEVTSSNYKTDLRTKVTAYADAKVPVYVIVDRRHNRLHVLTDPVQDEYATHRVHAPGELVTLPESIGAKVTLDVEAVLAAARRKPDSE
ncbi:MULTISPECIES: Uma2 family endonuclease [unclassified Streptomyces]|uniref:Uma2 family endonuclease n=1 Tax=unclassified Streptomyces TaxID=2593676 RepID=UPI000AD32E4C|nr:MULTISPECIES: Uma2 family endonuclease [unclassified Streptomyces]MCX5145875.1 Uma2 family endonuclease [Streptomyces sp. NBC_00320]WSN49117.1 Uma2 family endonuclease [Streptomyces sp. NBC_01296]WSW61477.1 Uma2 family endonuclease [Streptomyces sp. NBC_00998]